MSALNEIAKIKKSKLKTFQKEINAIRSGFLSDEIIQEWRELPDSERKLKITVFLCMAMFPEKDLERMFKILNPWWEPYKNGAEILMVTLVLFVSYRLATFFMKERVYPNVLEYDVTFIDESVIKYGLFSNASMILEDDTALLDANIFNWLFMMSKKSGYDSTKWTKDKEFYEDLKYFYGEFQGNALMSKELKKAALSIEDIYNSSVNITGLKKIKMDLYVPAIFSNNHSPFLQFPHLNDTSFFLSVIEGSRYWNIKIDFRDGKPIKWEQILFSPNYQIENNRKVIWDKDPKFYLPAAKKIFKGPSDQASSNYFIYKLDTSIAEQ